MKRVFIWMAAASMLAACNSKSNTITHVEEETVVKTKTVAAVEEKIRLTEEYTSEVKAYKENNITPAASGVHIDRILVDVGDKVREGQLLITLNPTQYNQARVQLKLLEDNVNRLRPVYEAGGISTQEFDQLKAQYDVQLEVVENLKRNIEVLSPISGVVTARNNEAGDLFMNQPVLHIMQINPLKVIANIPEQFFAQVKRGMSVGLKLDAYPDELFKGTVELIHPAINTMTRTFSVEVKVPNPSERLRPGMFARTYFDMGERNAVLIPDVALLKQVGSSERYIFVVKEGVAERRRVVVGRQQGQLVEILSGVEAGEEVAVTALSRLENGVKVEIVAENK
mgnify:CR=1 FL=1